MPTYRSGSVAAILSERAGLQRVMVAIDGEDQRAYNLVQLTGPVAIGDEVVCNTTAVGLALGTGGWHVVHWNLSRRSLDVPGGGHIMKLRYTSLQTDVGVAEEHAAELSRTLDGVPVVVCSLHSQIGVVAAAFHDARPTARLVYVMTDGAALPLALSDLVADLRSSGVIAATVTAGHAFGGDAEAVNALSALSVARHVLRADAVVVGMGPGVVGTGTSLGHTALEVAGVVDACPRLGARPIVAIRASEADTRVRHRGVSHHTTTALAICRGARLAVPVGDEDTDGLAAITGHARVGVEVGDVAELLARVGVSITSMGRGPADDPLFFRFASAAGVLAAHDLDPARGTASRPTP